MLSNYSDKIAKWNSLGIQGGLLSFLFIVPLYITTCTIGRKFSEPHLQRALCCRLQEFQYPPPVKKLKPSATNSICPIDAPVVAPFYCTHHPAMLCTSIKFDEGVVVTGEIISDTGPTEAKSAELFDGTQTVGAQFANSYCISWIFSNDCIDIPVVFNGRSGFREITSSDSSTLFQSMSISGHNIFLQFMNIVKLAFENNISEFIKLEFPLHDGRNQLKDDSLILNFESISQNYIEWKRFNREKSIYYRAKELLNNSEKFFRGWCSNTQS